LLNTSATQTLDLTGVKFTSGVTFDFTGSGATSLGPDERVLVVRNITAFETRYGSGLNIAGEFVDSGLSNGGEPVKLEDPTNSTIAQFTYDDGNGWPGRPDGKGASLEIIDTEGGYNDEDNWRSSVAYGGTPGAAPSAGLGVVVNEVLTHTDPPLADAIELHNATGSEIDLGGWYLSDSWGWDWSTENGDYKKFRIPDGTSIPARGHITFREGHYDWESSQWVFAVDQASEFGGPGAKDFALDGAYGDDVWLMKADPSGRLTHFGDHVEFTAAANGQALGRWPDASGGIYPMTEPTLGDPNSGPALGSVVVSEVHYNPDAAQGGDDHEFIEIYNTTGQAVDLTHWRIGKAVDFEFADGTTLDGYSTMVVVPFDPGDTGKLTSFLDAYGVQSPLDIVGGYTGSLNNAGEKVQLLSPDNEETPGFFPGLLEDELFYDDAGLWPAEADGSGDSLQRLGFYRFPNDPANWIAAAPTPGEVGVVGRYVFYNNSFFDGDDPNASPADDVAIATDKRALLPGGTADFRNYTAYSRGINGVMLDIGSLPAGVTELDALVDFEFEVGNDNDVENWLAAPQPADVDLRFVAGRPPRVTITWAGEAIQNKWLRVTVKDTADTGLVAPDVFYFGNSTGEVGDAADGLVTYSDLIQTRNDINLTAAVDVDSRFDFNRDRYVDYSDLILCRNNINLTMGLNLIEVPSHEPSGPAETLQPAAAIIPEPEGATAEAPLHDAVIQQVAEESPAAAESPSADASLAELTWFYEQDQLAAGNRTSENRDQAESAVDKLLATWP